jgi:hypothetical protein
MKDLQTVLDAIILLGRAANLCHDASSVEAEAIAIVKQMMQVEPVAFLDKYGEVFNEVEKLLPTDTPLYAAPQAVPDGKTCSNCTFHYKDIDMKPCSNCDRGDNISDNWTPMSTGQIALQAPPKEAV